MKKEFNSIKPTIHVYTDTGPIKCHTLNIPADDGFVRHRWEIYVRTRKITTAKLDIAILDEMILDKE